VGAQRGAKIPCCGLLRCQVSISIELCQCSIKKKGSEQHEAFVSGGDWNSCTLNLVDGALVSLIAPAEHAKRREHASKPRGPICASSLKVWPCGNVQFVFLGLERQTAGGGEKTADA